MMEATRDAVYHAAGAAVAAVDGIFGSRGSEEAGSALRTAFCCTRPPGHHAERHRSMGFCFVNNAGVAAKYAQCRYGVGNVAVVVRLMLYE